MRLSKRQGGDSHDMDEPAEIGAIEFWLRTALILVDARGT
jgi:hypothetical protein